MVQNKNNLHLEILLVLLKNQTHLREIARQLAESHSTIFRKLNNLLKENVVDYTQIGKSKIFFIKNILQAKTYIFMAEKYKLTKLLNKYPKLNIILDDILKKSNEDLIILFGSYAKFTAKNESDIDIYIETKNSKIKIKLKEINSSINIKIGEFNTSDLLIKEIIKNHVILKGVEKFYGKIKFFK